VAEVNDASRVWSPIDFEADGKQVDTLRVPISTDRSAYGVQPIPVVSIKKGKGKTALFIAGTHGDEYEGQIALRQLAAKLAPSEVSGRVIIIPGLNFPAVAAGSRVSPLDGGNLNRVFPGAVNGSTTEMIAHFVGRRLIPMADAVVDLHAGGLSLQYLTMALAHAGESPRLRRRTRELLEAFDAPYSLLTDGAAGGGATTLYANATTCGVPALNVELGGGATLSEKGLEIALRGLQRVLGHLGIIGSFDDSPATTRIVRRLDRAASIYAKADGLFRPLAEVGETVTAGQPAAELYRLEGAVEEPEHILFARGGTIATRRHLSHARAGDSLFTLFSSQEQELS
jgi:uncharacterized protein